MGMRVKSVAACLEVNNQNSKNNDKKLKNFLKILFFKYFKNCFP